MPPTNRKASVYLGSSQSVWGGRKVLQPPREQSGAPGLERAAGQRGSPKSLDLHDTAPGSGAPVLPRHPARRRVLWLPLDIARSGEVLSRGAGASGGLSHRQPSRTQGMSLHVPHSTPTPLPFLQRPPCPFTPMCFPSTCLPLPVSPCRQDRGTYGGSSGWGQPRLYRCAGAPAPSKTLVAGG